MSSEVSLEFLRAVALFSSLDDTELEELRWVARPFSLQPGESLFAEGDLAEAMFLIESGDIRLTRRLPGAKDAEIGTVSAGSVVGEMALVDGGRRSASAQAVGAVRGTLVPRQAFFVLQAGMRSSAMKIARRLAEIAAGRLRQVTTARGEHDEALAEGVRQAEIAAALQSNRRSCDGLDRNRLQLLPLFANLDDRELEAIMSRTNRLDVNKWQPLFLEGAPADACYVVYRGAVQALLWRNGERRRLNLSGPGEIFGHLALFDDSPRSAECVAREESILLELTKDQFDDLFSSGTSVGFKLFQNVNQLLVADLRRAHRRNAWAELNIEAAT